MVQQDDGPMSGRGRGRGRSQRPGRQSRRQVASTGGGPTGRGYAAGMKKKAGTERRHTSPRGQEDAALLEFDERDLLVDQRASRRGVMNARSSFDAVLKCGDEDWSDADATAREAAAILDRTQNRAVAASVFRHEGLAGHLAHRPLSTAPVDERNLVRVNVIHSVHGARVRQDLATLGGELDGATDAAAAAAAAEAAAAAAAAEFEAVRGAIDAAAPGAVGGGGGTLSLCPVPTADVHPLALFAAQHFSRHSTGSTGGSPTGSRSTVSVRFVYISSHLSPNPAARGTRYPMLAVTHDGSLDDWSHPHEKSA